MSLSKMQLLKIILLKANIYDFNNQDQRYLFKN